MDWNVVSAVATVIGTILTFVSILVAIRIERKKSTSSRKEPARKPPLDRLATEEPPEDEPHDPYAPYLYILAGLIGACGGVASILVPWLLLQASPDLQCFLYPLLITGLIGGVIGALFMDGVFEMHKSSPYLRFPLSAISGVIGGWLGVLVIIGGMLYVLETSERYRDISND